jgi:hypothetical protein
MQRALVSAERVPPNPSPITTTVAARTATATLANPILATLPTSASPLSSLPLPTAPSRTQSVSLSCATARRRFFTVPSLPQAETAARFPRRDEDELGAGAGACDAIDVSRSSSSSSPPPLADAPLFDAPSSTKPCSYSMSSSWRPPSCARGLSLLLHSPGRPLAPLECSQIPTAGMSRSVACMMWCPHTGRPSLTVAPYFFPLPCFTKAQPVCSSNMRRTVSINMPEFLSEPPIATQW